MKKYQVIFLMVLFTCTLLLSACKDGDGNSISGDVSSKPNVSSAEPTSVVSNSNQEDISVSEEWDVIPESDFEYRYDSNLQGVVVSYHGNARRVRFPDTINGDSVVEIENSASLSLEEVYIPDSVIHIGYRAFRDCENLVRINLPDGLTSIANEAFVNCGFKSINIPDSVTNIGEDAFASCKKLVDIEFPDTGVDVGGGAFSGTYWYDRLSDGLVRLGNVILGYKGDIPADIIIPDGVTRIAGEAFMVNASKEPVLTEQETSTGTEALYESNGLSTVILPDSVTVIGDFAFFACADLTSVTIPNNLQSIGRKAFVGCTGLTSLSIPDSVTYLFMDAFNGCSNLDEATKSRILQINPDVTF